jgi:Lysophospholipase
MKNDMISDDLSYQNDIRAENEEAELQRKYNIERIMKVLMVFLGVLLIITVGIGAYSLFYYKKADSIIIEMAQGYNYIEEDDWYLFSYGERDDNPAIFLFQQTKTDERAYFYLANQLQNAGYDVFIGKSLFRYPSFNVGIVDLAKEKYNKHEQWYLMGHGIGSEAIDLYLSNGNTGIAGAIYLGALPATNTVDLGIPLMIGLGTNDTVTNQQPLNDEETTYYSDNVSIYFLAGGNYTNFGYYDLEDGDSEAAIPPKEQQDNTAILIEQFIKNI